MNGAALLGGFAVLAALAIGLEVAARLGKSKGTPASLADAAKVALQHPGLRFVTQLAWLWLGWHLFVR